MLSSKYPMQIKIYTLSSSQHLSWDNSQKLNFRYIQHICFKCPPSPANSSSILLEELWGMLNSYDIQPKKNLRDYITFEVSRVFCPREWWCPKHVVYTVLGQSSLPFIGGHRRFDGVRWSLLAVHQTLPNLGELIRSMYITDKHAWTDNIGP